MPEVPASWGPFSLSARPAERLNRDVHRPSRSNVVPIEARPASLAQVQVGWRRRVVSVEDSARHELEREGVLPGAVVVVMARTPIGGPVIVELGPARLALSAAVARLVATEPYADPITLDTRPPASTPPGDGRRRLPRRVRRGDHRRRRPPGRRPRRPPKRRQVDVRRPCDRAFVETANVPGTTVSLARIPVTVDGIDAWLVDLPGTRSLDDEPAGESPFWELLLEAAPDAILVVADAGNLARHLPLAIACRDLGLPLVLAANLVDEASVRGIALDTGRLGQLLNAPVHATCGRTGEGVVPAVRDAVRLARRRRAVRAGQASPRGSVPASGYPWPLQSRLADLGETLAVEPRSLGAAAVVDPLQAGVLAGRLSPRGGASIRLSRAVDPVRWETAGAWATKVERRREVVEPLADRVARWSTSPFPGIPLFVGVGIGASSPSCSWAGGSQPSSGRSGRRSCHRCSTQSFPRSSRCRRWRTLSCGRSTGACSGCSWSASRTCCRSPPARILEDSGYLASAAVLMDRVFGTLGLPGGPRFAPRRGRLQCAGDLRTRVLRTRRQRVLASFLVTLTPCSARSAVVIAALAPFAACRRRSPRSGSSPSRRSVQAWAERVDPRPPAGARPGACTPADAGPPARRDQGLVAVSGLRRPRDAHHARRLIRARAGVRGRAVAGHRRRDRAGHRVVDRAARHRRRRDRVRVPAQGARAPAARCLCRGRTGLRGGARRGS